MTEMVLREYVYIIYFQSIIPCLLVKRITYKIKLNSTQHIMDKKLRKGDGSWIWQGRKLKLIQEEAGTKNGSSTGPNTNESV